MTTVPAWLVAMFQFSVVSLSGVLLDYLMWQKVQQTYLASVLSRGLNLNGATWRMPLALRHAVILLVAGLAVFIHGRADRGQVDFYFIALLGMVALWWCLLAFDAMRDLRRQRVAHEKSSVVA